MMRHTFNLLIPTVGVLCVVGCSGSGLGLFEKKPETTPGGFKVQQSQTEEGNVTTITGTNDANAKDGMSAQIGDGGDVQITTGGSRKLEKWGAADSSDVQTWGWVYLVFGCGMIALRVNGMLVVPASLGIGAVGIGLFNLTLAPTLLPILTGALWNIMCVGLLIKFGVPGIWANLRQQIKAVA